MRKSLGQTEYDVQKARDKVDLVATDTAAGKVIPMSGYEVREGGLTLYSHFRQGSKEQRRE